MRINAIWHFSNTQSRLFLFYFAVAGEFLSFFNSSSMRMFHTTETETPTKNFHNYWTKRCCLLPRFGVWCTIFQLMHHANLIQINTLDTSAEHWKLDQMHVKNTKVPRTCCSLKMKITNKQNKIKEHKNTQKIEKNCFVNWLPHTH